MSEQSMSPDQVKSMIDAIFGDSSPVHPTRDLVPTLLGVMVNRSTGGVEGNAVIITQADIDAIQHQTLKLEIDPLAEKVTVSLVAREDTDEA